MDQNRLSLFQVTVGEDSLPRSLGGHGTDVAYSKERLDGAEHSVTWRIHRNVTANLFDDP
jgi:hypothetical protein